MAQRQHECFLLWSWHIHTSFIQLNEHCLPAREQLEEKLRTKWGFAQKTAERSGASVTRSNSSYITNTLYVSLQTEAGCEGGKFESGSCSVTKLTSAVLMQTFCSRWILQMWGCRVYRCFSDTSVQQNYVYSAVMLNSKSWKYSTWTVQLVVQHLL